MEEQRIENPEMELPEEEIAPEAEAPEENRPAYTPRPTWQIVLAWVGLGIMVVSIILYYWQIANGGI